MFLEMDAQIIAKQMTMIILQTILKALGAVAGAAGGGGNFDAKGAGSTGISWTDAVKFKRNAMGNAFDANGIVPFANGGVFNSPTFFKFANGGTMQNGVLGEAGPEAIMPLSRGAGGKLGVNASGLREAMGGAPGMGGAPVLSMSFETTRFGDTDYVSRDQLEAAMAQTRKQASSDGAKRGMSMTLDRLQQSPQTRSRVGIR
jgi:phage-related minor tail protein